MRFLTNASSDVERDTFLDCIEEFIAIKREIDKKEPVRSMPQINWSERDLQYRPIF